MLFHGQGKCCRCLKNHPEPRAGKGRWGKRRLKECRNALPGWGSEPSQLEVKNSLFPTPPLLDSQTTCLLVSISFSSLQRVSDSLMWSGVEMGMPVSVHQVPPPSDQHRRSTPFIFTRHVTTVKVQPAPCNLAVFHKHCVFIFDLVLLSIIIESPWFINSVHIPFHVFFQSML